MKNPRFGVQTCAPAIQRHAHFYARQSGQGIYCAGLCRPDVGRGQNSKSGFWVARGIQCGHLGQHVHQLAHTAPGDEANQNVHPIHGLEFSA